MAVEVSQTINMNMNSNVNNRRKKNRAANDFLKISYFSLLFTPYLPLIHREERVQKG